MAPDSLLPSRHRPLRCSLNLKSPRRLPLIADPVPTLAPHQPYAYRSRTRGEALQAAANRFDEAVGNRYNGAVKETAH